MHRTVLATILAWLQGRLNASPHAAALVLLLLIFVSLNLFATLSLRSWRVDLTQNQLFTLSQGTRNILAKIDEPVVLKFYYSQNQAAEQPQIRLFAGRVRDMLEEMTGQAGGRIKLKSSTRRRFPRPRTKRWRRVLWRVPSAMAR